MSPFELDRLRDEFAGRVLESAMANATGLGQMDGSERKQLLRSLAGLCYEAADAMMEARDAK